MFSLEMMHQCKWNGCDNDKKDGSEYCTEHTCKADNCTLSKSKYDAYCYIHQQEYACAYTGCNMNKVTGGEYCYTHTCNEYGCFNQKNNSSDYCSAHQVNMRELLRLDYFYIDQINSAGGIEICFDATNLNRKEIKYIRFYVDLYNRVGDRIVDEITDKSSVYVEITGPIKYKDSVEFEDIIGYNDTCGRVEIEDITIVYMDGTSYTGRYGYYAD